MTSPELLELRSEIDTIDRELVRMLAKRRVVSKRAQALKEAHGLPAYDAEREREMLVVRDGWAEEESLPSVEEIFEAILASSR